MTKQKRLGRGLEALFGDTESAHANAAGDIDAPVAITHLGVDQLQRGRYQPRSNMDAESLEVLAQSIKSKGLIQAISVRKISRTRYEIIAGERRWRAAQLAGLSEVPVSIRDIDDESALEMALIENIQREDLNPIEEAAGLKRLADEFDFYTRSDGSEYRPL